MRTHRLSIRRSSRGLAAATIVWISTGAVLVLPGRAGATTVTRVDFGGVTFEDLMVNGQPGEANDISVSFAANPAFPTDPNAGTYTITDQTANITPGPGCTAVDVHEVQCAQRNPLNGETIDHDIVVNTGDLADDARIASTGQVIAVSIAGNDGNDELVIVSTPAAIRSLSGGGGEDRLEGAADLEGGDGADTLASGSGRQVLNGGADRDVVTYASRAAAVNIDLRGPVFPAPGLEGEDMILGVEDAIGGAGDDNLIGGTGANDLRGGGGDDSFVGDPGADTVDGGAGADLIDYGGRSGDVGVDLNGGPTSGDSSDGVVGARDALTGVENVVTGPGRDTVTGNAARNWIDSGPGGDEVAGGGGVDTMDYSRRVEPLYVELTGASESGGATDGPEGARDSIAADVEDVIGGDGDDWLVGSTADNHLAGEGGADLLTGEAGADVLAGGPGADIVDYVDRTVSLTIDLDGVAGDDGAPSEGDSVGADVEGIWGGAGADQLTGNGEDNLLDGGLGADTLRGLGGFDLADYSDRLAAVSVDLDGQVGDDGESGEGDTVVTDVEDVNGGAGDDVLVGDGAENLLVGGAGADTLDGGPGSDGLFGDDGGDLLRSNDGVEDGDICGAGPDSVVADFTDFVEVDCEQVQRIAAGDPAPPLPPARPAPPLPPALPAPPDTTAPVPTVKIRPAGLSRTLRRGFVAAVTCGEPCTVNARLSIKRKIAKRRKVPRLVARGAARIAAPGTTTVVLQFHRSVRRRLAGVRVLRATLVISARDAAGNAAEIERSVTIRR